MPCIREREEGLHTWIIEVSILRECSDRSKDQSEDSSYAITIPHLREASTRYSRVASGNSEAETACHDKGMVVVYYHSVGDLHG